MYDFKCNLCNQNYIGQTCRPFQIRYKEHERSLKNEDQKSALSDHALKYHRDRAMSINDFSYSILDQQHTAIATRVAESRYIATKMPKINRRQEMTSWDALSDHTELLFKRTCVPCQFAPLRLSKDETRRDWKRVFKTCFKRINYHRHYTKKGENFSYFF